MKAVQDLIQSAWTENEHAIQKKKANEEKRRADEANAEARIAAKAKADAAWARAHERRHPYPKIHLFVRIIIAVGVWVPWAYCLGIPLSIIGRVFSEGLGIAFGGIGFLASFVAATGTPEILHYVSEKFRLAKQRKKSLAEYERYQRLAT